MMRSLTVGLSLLTLAAVFASDATEGPREVLITPDATSRLGFSVESKRDDSGLVVVTVTGPAVDSQGCRASRSGVALVDENHELLVSITELPDSNTGPTQMGYAADSDQMRMFFDYLRCSEGIHPTRYLLESIDAFAPPSKSE